MCRIKMCEVSQDLWQQLQLQALKGTQINGMDFESQISANLRYNNLVDNITIKESVVTIKEGN